ncbi:MAG: helix-turn-helix domain-containing protein, partial [Terracidiphilus sp.]
PSKTAVSNRNDSFTSSDVLTLVQAAEFLKCHAKTLRIQATKGLIPGKRIGSLWRFYRPTLEVWMQEAA